MSDHVVHDPVGAARAFEAGASRMLAFLDTPAPVASSFADVLRGPERIFDAMQLGAANEAAKAAAAAAGAEAAAVSAGAPPASDFGALGVDLSAMPIDQVMQLMMGCAFEFMRRMAAASPAQG